jgi:hypothetical protein
LVLEDTGKRVLSILLLWLLLLPSPFFPEWCSIAAENDAPGASDMDPNFRFPRLDPAHTHMRLLLENAVRYVDPKHGIVDPVSGYPVEGWNQDPRVGLHLRSFTQLTAIGLWVELMANIAAGEVGAPFVSKSTAMDHLSLAVKSLLEDQVNPFLSAKGLLVNFLGLEGGVRKGPLVDSIERERLVAAFGGEKGTAIWQGLEKKGWILPEDNGRKGRIRRGEKYGAAHFDGALAPFADEPVRSSIMNILDQRVVLVIFGDNVNLTASMAKAVGALLHPSLRDDPRAAGLREEMERFMDGQKGGYSHLFDPKTGTFLFGWDATADRFVGWDDGHGNWVRGQMNFLINEFRGPWVFAVLRYGLPEVSIRNAGFKMKPYRKSDGEWIHSLAAWDGSAFQLLGLSLFMQEHLNPGWKRCLQNIVEIELDYARRRGFPGFLSEAYSGNGAEYTGYIGIPELAVTDKPLITHTPSLYTLGVSYLVAPEKIEKFLWGQWPTISRLFTEHGPWEGYDVSAQEAIRFQTTVHTLSLILGGAGSSHENMRRYLDLKGLYGLLEKLYRPGDRLDLLSEAHEITPWSADRDPIRFHRGKAGCRFQSERIGMGGMTFRVAQDHGTSLSNGRLRIRYRSDTVVKNARIAFRWAQAEPAPTTAIPTEIFLHLRDTRGAEEEMEIVLPAAPSLHGIREVSLLWGNRARSSAIDLSVTGFEFIPFGLALGDREPLPPPAGNGQNGWEG